MSQLAVVVVNYASHALLAQHLVQTAGQLPEATIVVVDNSESEGDRAAVARLAREQGWHLEAPGQNLGFGGGCNLGVRGARALGATEFLLLNPDAVIDAENLALLRAAVAADPLALVAPRVVRPDGSTWFDGIDLDLRTGRMRSRRAPSRPDDVLTPWLTGACLLASEQLWDLVGGFDPEYFLYWEDVDLSYRVIGAGGAVRLVREAVAMHDEGGTQEQASAVRGSRAKSSNYYYFSARNRLLFAAKHLDAAARRRWLRLAPQVGYEVLLHGGRRQLLHPRRPVGAVVRGIRDGRRMARTIGERQPRG